MTKTDMTTTTRKTLSLSAICFAVLTFGFLCVSNISKSKPALETPSFTRRSFQPYFQPPPQEVSFSARFPPTPFGNTTWTILTTATSTSICHLESLLRSIDRSIEPSNRPRVVVHTAKLPEWQIEIMEQMYWRGLMDEVVEMNVDIKSKKIETSGLMLNKAEFMTKAAVRFGGIIVFLDPTTFLSPRAAKLIHQQVRRHGFWSPSSGHRGLPAQLEDLVGENVSSLASVRRCSENAFGMDMEDPKVVAMLDRWNDLDAGKDEDMLTFLAAKNGFRCELSIRGYGLEMHPGRGCRESLEKVVKEGVELGHPNSLDFLGDI